MDRIAAKHRIHSLINAISAALRSRLSLSDKNGILLVFLIVILFTSFIIPFVDFGRLYGTDDYSHLFHTQRMSSGTSLNSFYDTMRDEVSNSEADINPFNYPFGLWLYGSAVVKLTGLPPVSAVYLFAILFFFLLVAAFYCYAGAFLPSRDHRLMATLFFLSMPNMALSVLSYRPSIFTLPFLFLILFIASRDRIDLKLLPFLLISIFIVVVSHTGTFIFLLIFSIVYFLLFCLLWGKFSRPFYLTILSTFVIYIISLNWFPQIANQYEVKSSLFLTTGNFLATKFNIVILADLGKVFYENLLVGQQFIYAIIFGAIIFTLGEILLYFHRRAEVFFHKSGNVYPLILPLQNISHSVVATPVWIGPVQCICSIPGFFFLDNKGRCIFISALICTLLPDWFQTSQGIFAETGALREVSFLVIIIPVTAALGFWGIINYIDQSKNPRKKIVSGIIWFMVLSSAILIPVLSTTYYLPRISGENYLIDGMKWLGDNGDTTHDKVVGYGYRTVPIYTNMSDSSYGLQSGTETRSFTRFLKGIYFTKDAQYPNDFMSRFGTRFILSSDKIFANFGNTRQNATIDDNAALNKIYSCSDFGIYDIITSPNTQLTKKYLADNITMEKTGSTLVITSGIYKVVLDDDTPTIEGIGSPRQNMLGEGFFREKVRITGTGKDPDFNQYSLDSIEFTREIVKNQIIYRTILTGRQKEAKVNMASLIVTYTFFPDMVEREYILSNDWPGSSPQKNMYLSTDIFTSISDFVMLNNQARQERHIYESEDAIIKNEKITDLYVHRGDEGIFIKYGQTSPYPSSLTYKGSTIYNMSAVSVSQANQIKPGASLHIIQYISIGDELTSEKNILNHAGIILSDYPHGETPLVITGYRTPVTEQMEMGNILRGYEILTTNEIPYTEAIIPSRGYEMTSAPDPNDIYQFQESYDNSSGQEAGPVHLQNISRLGMPIIGALSTGTRYFDNRATQERNIAALITYARSEGVELTGFMPTSLNYNLDTIKILADTHIPFILAIPVNPPIKDMYDQGYRNPEIAYYHENPTGMVMFPVSYPLSTSILYQSDPDDIFTSWKSTIDQASRNGEMVLFILRSNDIGNPIYTDDFVRLIAYAREKNLGLTTPDVLADHFQKLQNIEYQGTIDNDRAIIAVTNNNQETVRDVTFKVLLPVLPRGNYRVENPGNNIRIEPGPWQDDNQWMLVTLDLPPRSKAQILIIPEAPPENISVEVPAHPVEGSLTLTVRRNDGSALKNAEVSVDLKNFRTDGSGKVKFDARRGTHLINVVAPGYHKASFPLDVSGRLYVLKELFHS